MQTADFNYKDFQPNMQREQDKGLLVKFYYKSRQDKEASTKECRPMFKEVEYVDIKIPGNRGAGACRPATDADKNRFPDHYRAFKDRTETAQDMGMPLVEWPAISRSRCEELSFFNVKTVEQLATMADTQCGQFMGLTSLREKAKQWLTNAEKEKPLWEADQKNRELQGQIDELKDTVSSLIEQVESKPDQELNGRQKTRKKERAVKAAKAKV